MGDWIQAKLAHIFHREMQKHWYMLVASTSFQGFRRLKKNIVKYIVCTLSLGWIDEFYLDSHICIIDILKNWSVYGDLDPIVKVIELKEVLKFLVCTACPEWIWVKFTHIYYWEIKKKWLYFGDLNLISKGHRSHFFFLKKELSASYILNIYKGLNHINKYHIIPFGHLKILISFGWPLLCFQGHLRS